MPYCTYCGQSFTRDEHLERHILTHTNVKPYKCFNCHMSFARRDLLHRHYTVHGRDGNQEPLTASNGIIPKSAGRTPIACSNCAKTKTKCDKKFPCSRCESRNLKCTARPTRRTTKNMVRAMEQHENPMSANSHASGQSQDESADSSQQSSARNTPPAEPQQTDHEKGNPDEEGESDPPAILPETQPADAKANTSAPPPVMSPAPTPGSSFMQQAPLSGFDTYMRPASSNQDESDPTISGPQYMLDWSQVQMPLTYDSSVTSDLLMSTPISFAPTTLADTPESMPFLPSYYTTPNATFQTPLSTSVDRGYPPTGLETPISNGQPSRQASSPGPGTDYDAAFAGQDAWSAFRCTPGIPSSACPKTAKTNLEKLEASLKDHDAWTNWRPSWDEADYAFGDQLSVAPLQEMPRDKLLAITQTFLHKALEIHQDEQGSPSLASGGSCGYSNFVILPPARVLEYFLRSYSNSFERFYPLTSKGLLDPNMLMQGRNDKASSLLLLLMISQGALITPSIDGRWLTGGLIEACRISLFDLIEKNIMLSGDPMVLHSALLFTVQAGWSGDKWQMDIAMGQRGMYFAMLRHSGFLEAQRASAPVLAQRSNIDALWDEWIQQESRGRLVYAWVMVDQDLSLFHDTAPLFSVTEFGAPMPDSDALWHAKSSKEWSSIFEQVHEFSGGYSSLGSGARPLCLRDLFRMFLDDAIVSQGIELTPLHLRLLLHPLQSLVCQFRQLLSCFSDTSGFRIGSKSVTAASTRIRLEEVQALFQRWYALTSRYLKNNPLCPLMQANLVMFHLISLNAVTNFPEIERHARREDTGGSYQELTWCHKQCIADVEEAVFHGGQILRLVRSMPRSIRPPWWAGAIYRAALLFWCHSLVHSATTTQTSGAFTHQDSSVAVDGLPPDHGLVVRYLTKREGIPTLTRRDGSQIPIENPFAMLFHCVDIISEGVSTRFSDAIRNKLTQLAKS